MRAVELRVLCEGPTEEHFVSLVLKPHLEPFRVFPKAQALTEKGSGIVPFERLYLASKKEVGRLRSHQYVTPMIDLYKIGAYPGNEKKPRETGRERARRIEAGMAKRLPTPQFIPYVQVHEFEALVFVDLDHLPSQFPDGEADGAPNLLCAAVGNLSPEEIDDGDATAPSKRLVAAVPAYEKRKRRAGPAIAARSGVDKLKRACPHFAEWMSRLETLAKPILTSSS